jgi:beta-galactosidase
VRGREFILSILLLTLLSALGVFASTVVLDDFDISLNRFQVEKWGGEKLDFTIDSKAQKQGRGCLRVDYKIEGAWMGGSLNRELRSQFFLDVTTEDWSNTSSLVFYAKHVGDNKATLMIELYDEINPTVAFYHMFTPKSKDWELIKIPFSSFHSKTTGVELDLSRLYKMRMVVANNGQKPVEGTLWLDWLARTSDEVAPLVNLGNLACVNNKLNAEFSLKDESQIALDSLEVALNGKKYYLDNKIVSFKNGKLTFQEKLLPGVYKICISAADVVGNKRKYEWTFTYYGGETYSLGRTVYSLNDTWSFSGEKRYNTADMQTAVNDPWPGGKYWEPGYKEQGWKLVKVPHVWIVRTDYIKDEKMVSGVYRKNIFIPDTERGKEAILKFDAVSWRAEVWVNGKEIGVHQGALVPFEYDITHALRYNQDNTIVVKVIDDFLANRLKRHVFGWSNIGIYSSVDLEFREELAFEEVFLTPSVERGELLVDTTVVNQEALPREANLQAVLTPYGREEESIFLPVADLKLEPGENKLSFTLKTPDLKLWDPDDPNLYVLGLVLKNEKIQDLRTEIFGYREFTSKGRYFYFNGKQEYLFGGHLVLSELPSEEELARILLDFKRQGYRIMRPGGNPAVLPSRLLSVADQVGIMIYAELPSIKHTSLDEEGRKAFFDEASDWVRAYYNHPSVVMWALSNEAWNDGSIRVLDSLYSVLRPIDKQGRPIILTAGAYAFPGLPTIPSQTDAFDLHDYSGMGFPGLGAHQKVAWTFHNDLMRQTFKNNEKIFGQDPNRPTIAFETVGFSWGSTRVFPEGEIDRDTYYRTMLGEPDGVNDLTVMMGSKHIGLRKATRPGAVAYAKNLFGKRILEQERLLGGDLLQGIGPWTNTTEEVANLVFKPTMVGLDLYNKNVFAGRELMLPIFISNVLPEAKENMKLELKMVGPDGKQVFSEDIKGISYPANTTKILQHYKWPIPADAAGGWYKVKMTLIQGENVLSQNEHEFFILSQKQQKVEVKTDGKVAVWLPPLIEEKTIAGTLAILQEIDVAYSIITDVSGLSDYQYLVIPAIYSEQITLWDQLDHRINETGQVIRAWLEAGGRLLNLEQSATGTIPWLREFDTKAMRPAIFMDVAVPSHPIFTTLSVDNFDQWSTERGVLCNNALYPFSPNMLGVVADFGTDEIFNAIIEAKVGKGFVVASQLKAVAEYQVNSAANKYLKNLFAYLLAGSYEADARVVKGNKPPITVALKDAQMVDLSAYCNMGFADGVEGDQKGGWTDQGPLNDLREFPLGLHNFNGIPFTIIDPAQNHGKSMIVLRGSAKQFYPLEAKGIKIDSAAKKVCILTISAWTAAVPIGERVFTVHVNYKDGSKEQIPIRRALEVEDWWGPRDLPNAKVGWLGSNAVAGKVGAYLVIWDNPYPEKVIESLDLVSEGKAIPGILGITLEKN